MSRSKATSDTATWNGERVFVYSRSGDSWIEDQILTSSDGEAGDKFGGYFANAEAAEAPVRSHDLDRSPERQHECFSVRLNPAPCRV